MSEKSPELKDRPPKAELYPKKQVSESTKKAVGNIAIKGSGGK